MAFIEQLQTIIFDYVRKNSTYESKHGGGSGGGGHERRQPKKGVLKGATEPGSKKRGADEISRESEPQPAADGGPHHQSRQRRSVVLPLPAGYTAYPTVRDVAKYIENSGVTNNTILSESEVQQLVNVLVYDDVLERVRLPRRKEWGYRVTNIARLDPHDLTKQLISQQSGEEPIRLGAPPASNGITEVPCGGCPVFDLCEVGGPVSPGNCVYYKRWLGLDV